MRLHESCDGCLYDLGGGRDNCLLNVAHECRDGGGFEAWENEEEVTYMAEVSDENTCSM